ncbi:MAG: PfkB family carbohydrate kinase [Saprospiraceae bacterium]
MENFRSIFEQFNHLNIMVVGDIMIDRYLSGKVTRISPEAPVPVVALESRENRLGGAANVALNIKALGANPILISVVGNDNEGAIFKKILPENGISSDFLHTSNSRKNNCKNSGTRCCPTIIESGCRRYPRAFRRRNQRA